MKSTNKKIINPISKLGLVAASTVVVMAASSVTVADVKLSGRVFHSAVDRDSAEDIEFQTPGNAGYTISLNADHEIGNGLTTGLAFRLSDFGSGTDIALDEKSLYLSGAFGKLDLGHNLTASAFVEAYAGHASYWIDPLGWLNWGGATNSASFNPFLLTGSTTREERLRYDTPNFSGFSARGQLGDNGTSELALLYSNYGIIANAFTIDGADVKGDTTGFLVAYNAPFGLHISYSSSEEDKLGGGEDKYSGAKLGYTFGKHAVSVSGHVYEQDGVADDYERSSFSYVYSASDRFQLFAQYTEEELGAQDDDAIALGAGLFF
ncbi:MAG: porin [Cellvibrionaceae bacterium]